MVASGLLVAGGALGPPYQAVLWASALAVDYAGIWLAGTSGWRLNSPAHFAERYGLIVIVALGESLVAIGVGVAERPVSAAVIAASVLGVSVAVSLWWLYFDVVAHVAEGVLRSPASRWSPCTPASRSTFSGMSRSAVATSAPGTPIAPP